jgi:hypothetical protein
MLQVQPSILLSLVIPAYNKQDRIPIMLKAAHQCFVSPMGKALIRKLQACMVLSAGNGNGNANANAKELRTLNGVLSMMDPRMIPAAFQSMFEALKSNHAWKLVSLKASRSKGVAVKTGILCAKGHF